MSKKELKQRLKNKKEYSDKDNDLINRQTELLSKSFTSFGIAVLILILRIVLRAIIYGVIDEGEVQLRSFNDISLYVLFDDYLMPQFGTLSSILLAVIALYFFVRSIIIFIAIPFQKFFPKKYKYSKTKSKNTITKETPNYQLLQQTPKKSDPLLSVYEIHEKPVITEKPKKKCPKCGAGNGLDAKFCMICNAKFKTNKRKEQ